MSGRAVKQLVRVAAAALGLIASAGVVAAPAVSPEARDAFTDAWPHALQGDWPLTRKDERLLKDYPLWPDLRAAYYSARLDETPARELQRFMREHDGLAPIRRLRYRYISRLAQRGDWRQFFALYDGHYRNARIAALDCLALAAAIDGHDRDTPVAATARRLWLVGSSQHAHCDASFERLLADGVLTGDDVRQRFTLAIEARNFPLARYLAKRLDETERAQAASWQRVHDAPTIVLDEQSLSTLNGEQVEYALRRLALSDPLAAAARWQALRTSIDAKRGAGIERHIAIATAQDHHPQALAMLRELPAAASDQRALEWRARSAMRQAAWDDVLRAIGLMSPEAAASDRWRYWEAVALANNGQADVAEQLLQVLAQERSFYGFLAADRIGEPYRFANVALDVDQPLLARLAGEPALIRALELYATGFPARAAHEWSRALRDRPQAELRAAAALAHRHGWHAEAIMALAAIEAYDDLAMRYPLAYSEQIQRHAGQASVSPSWVYGIARSESLFKPEVRSSAGAWGLMQLMPATGRRMAQQTGVRWRGIDTLKDADSNIALGTHYLAALNARFTHRALATAAYNAGPQRVLKWLPDGQPLPADVWIETIAYDETRDYVQRVLSADIIFQWRMAARNERLSDMLTPVAAKQTAETLASRL